MNVHNIHSHMVYVSSELLQYVISSLNFAPMCSRIDGRNDSWFLNAQHVCVVSMHRPLWTLDHKTCTWSIGLNERYLCGFVTEKAIHCYSRKKCICALFSDALLVYDCLVCICQEHWIKEDTITQMLNIID